MMIASAIADGIKRFNLLVVDDEEENRQLLVSLLHSQGYSVITAPDGPTAIEDVQSGQVGLVLLDVMMPRMDGIEVCTLIRRDLKLPSLPVVFVTSLSDRESRVRAKEAGADDFLVKPVDALELLVRVENLLRVRAYTELVEQHAEVLERELASSTERLLHIERLSTVGSLAAGVGYELGNLAAMCRGAVDLAQHSVRSNTVLEQRDLEKLDRVVKHIEHHSEWLLKLGHAGTEQSELLDLSTVVSGAVELIKGTGRARHARITVKLPEVPPKLRMSRAQLEQVVFNLILNASDALLPIKDRARTIEVRVDPPDALDRARLLVIDNGTGIEEHVLTRVFDPYFTTKPEGRGTGLGLTLVRHIVESMGGRVVLLSRPGEGATACVDFPIAGRSVPSL